jgi:predicted amidohydrolase
VLPELWPNGGFTYELWESTAQPLDGPLLAQFSALAAELRIHLHLGSFIERRRDGGLSNTSVLLAPDGAVLTTYRKIHLFGFADGEPKFLTAGEDLAVVATELGRVGLATCYDLRFPELFRALLDHGAELVLVPAAWPASRVAHWNVLAQARAIENQCVVVAVNAVGEQGGKTMGGRSIIVDARGAVLDEAGSDAAIVDASFDLADVREWREVFPVIPDRRLR